MEYLTFYNGLILLLAFVVSIIIEMMILPRVIFIAKKKRLFDLPDKRKKHSKPIPRLGGITFTPVVLLVLCFVLFIRFKFQLWDEVLMFYKLSELFLFVSGLLLIYLLGAKDDLVGVSFEKKFIIQFLASLCIVGSGLYVNNLYGLFGFYEIPHIIGILLSIGFIIFTTNAINLIDGADGLASGLAGIALITYSIFFIINGMWMYASFSLITLGILIPFFYYNFCHPNRKIFMGDTGSLTLGFMLSFMFMRLAKYPPVVEIVPDGLILLVITPLFIPLFDALKVMVVRMAMGKAPFYPDRNHIHHKLIDLNISKQNMVYILISTSIVFIAINWILLKFINVNLVLILDLGIATLSNILIYRKIRHNLSSNDFKDSKIEISHVSEEKIRSDS